MQKRNLYPVKKGKKNGRDKNEYFIFYIVNELEGKNPETYLKSL